MAGWGAWYLTEAKAHELFSRQRVALQAPFSFTPGPRQVARLDTGSYQLSELQLADAFQDLMKRRCEKMSSHFIGCKGHYHFKLTIREFSETSSFSGENKIWGSQTGFPSSS